MIVDLEDKEESGSFELKGGGKVHLRLMSRKDIKEIRDATTTVVSEYPLLGEGKDAKYQRFEAEKVDVELLMEMRLDRNITGWDGLFDRNEKPIPVTKENKVLLMVMVPEFREAVDDGLAALKKAEMDRAEQLEKN